jgi:predicted alpha/beta-fold hydrolase
MMGPGFATKVFEDTTPVAVLLGFLAIVVIFGGLGLVWWECGGIAEREKKAVVQTALETCDPVDLAVCELHLMTQEDYTRMYQESTAVYLEAATQAQALAAQCQAMLVKVVGAEAAP